MTRDTTPTDRRAYEKPEIGDDWAQAWDELVEDLDSASLYVDSTENTTESEPVPGTTHFEDVDANSVNTDQTTITNILPSDYREERKSETDAFYRPFRAVAATQYQDGVGTDFVDVFEPPRIWHGLVQITIDIPNEVDYSSHLVNYVDSGTHTVLADDGRGSIPDYEYALNDQILRFRFQTEPAEPAVVVAQGVGTINVI